MGGNCLAAALMLFQEAHPSSKLGDVPLKTPCIIFLMMLPPKQSQKLFKATAYHGGAAYLENDEWV